MVLYIQQATKRLLLPAEGAIACFEQVGKGEEEQAVSVRFHSWSCCSVSLKGESLLCVS